MQSVCGPATPVLTAYTTLAVPPCAAVLQYSLHTPFAKEHCTPHTTTQERGPRGAGWPPWCALGACHLCPHLCNLLLPAPSWCLLCLDRGAQHEFASCSCGLSDPHPICMVRALCKSRKISKIQSQHQTSFSPDGALLVLSLLVIWMSPAPGSMFSPCPQHLHVTALETGRAGPCAMVVCHAGVCHASAGDTQSAAPLGAHPLDLAKLRWLCQGLRCR